MRIQLTDEVWANLAQSLDVEEAALRAIAAVESAGSGFLRGQPPRPTILFEAHAFHRLTGGRFAQQVPSLSHAAWDRTQYAKSDAVAERGIRVLIANLTDAAERNDDTCKPYGHSLLYLVSRSFEEHEETPLLGMEKHLVPALATKSRGSQVRQLRCPGEMWDDSSAATRATTHGGLDDDQAVRDAVAAFVRASD